MIDQTMLPPIPAWEPFSLGLLVQITAAPETLERQGEPWPFIRWLTWHIRPGFTITLDNSSKPDRPVPLDVADGSVDLLHVAEEVSPDELRALIGSWRRTLSARAVLVLTAPGHAGAVRTVDAPIELAIGDGITLLPVGSDCPAAIAWLAGLSAADRQDFEAVFNALGEQSTVTAEMAAMGARVAQQTQALIRERQGRDRDVKLLRASRDEEHLHGLAMSARVDQLTAERDAIYRSSSWRLTAPLRGMVRIISPPGGAAGVADSAGPDAPADPKQAFKDQLSDELWDFLTSGGRLRLPVAGQPATSILLVLYNQAALTLACLRSIAATVPDGAEVVIVDNASSDQTTLLLSRVDGARVIRNAENRHFLHAVNQAAEVAAGRDLLLLNNDACLLPGALAAAQQTLYAAPDVGAVGSKIVLVDGSLQEAGSIVWNDGSCLGYGRGRSPAQPEFQFRRDVDYCSGAFLLVKAALFRELGGLDVAFAPAYYEETDFCLRLQAAGHRVVYEPAAQIAHYEFGSASTSEQALALQREHWGLFAQRHAGVLQRSHLAPSHLAPSKSVLEARMVRDRRRLLYIDDRVPYPELGAGYPRAARMLTLLQQQGWFVTFYPLYTPQDDWDAVYTAFPREIEFMLDRGPDGLPEFLAERSGYYDTILVSRPHNMRIFLDSRGDAPGASTARPRLIYDAEAVFATREFLRLELLGTPPSPERRREMLKEELDLTREADTVVTVSGQEAEIFRGAGCGDVRVLGLGIEPRPIRRGFNRRHDFLFVGSLAEDKSPNTDSVVWFVRDVMPLLDERIGTGYRLLVAGRCRAERVLALAGPRVELLDLVDDLVPFYARSRVFVAPTRFAAGRPYKVEEAVSHGLPVVATKLLARQLGWTHGEELLTGGTAEEFAASCARLHGDPDLWYAVRRRGLERMARDAAASDFAATLGAITGSPALDPDSAVTT